LNIHKKNYKSLFIRSRALKQLNRWEEALEVIKMAIHIKTTRSLLKDLEEIEERLGTEKLIIKENEDEDLEFVEEIKDSNILQLLLRALKYFALSMIKKKKYMFMLLSLILFLLYKNKIKSGFLRFLNILG